MPTTTPLARTTSRTFRSVAPSEASIPIERSRRCATTVKPPTATRAMRSIPSVTPAMVMLSGLTGLLFPAACTDTTFGPMWLAATPGASNSTVTSEGVRTWPGATSANSSSRFCGFSTMPVIRRPCQSSPTRSRKSAATPLVTATSPGPAG